MKVYVVVRSEFGANQHTLVCGVFKTYDSAESWITQQDFKPFDFKRGNDVHTVYTIEVLDLQD